MEVVLNMFLILIIDIFTSMEMPEMMKFVGIRLSIFDEEAKFYLVLGVNICNVIFQFWHFNILPFHPECL